MVGYFNKTDLLPLWSKGISNWTDYSGGTRYRDAASESHEKVSFFEQRYKNMSGLVWVRLGSVGEVSDLNAFVTVLNQLSHPIILLTTDGDCSVPSSLDPETVESIISHPLVRYWYTQNYDGTPYSKIRAFPIGLDLHTVRDPLLDTPHKLLEEIDAIRMAARPVKLRGHQIACDLHLSISNAARVEALNELQNCPYIGFLAKRISQSAIWQFYSGFAMVLSTHGNGLDCHRTWELLKLGCIVITKTSSLDPLYEGLPVVIVNSWSECNDRKQLERWIRDMAHLTDKNYIDERLSCKAWVARLKTALNSK